MAKSLMKLLAIPALLAGMAQSRPTQVEARQDNSDTCPFTAVIPDNAYYQVGSDLVLTWNPGKLPPGTLQLDVQSNLISPIITGYGINMYGQKIPIYDYKATLETIGFPNLSERSYTWHVKVLGNATGPDYVYTIRGSYVVQNRDPYGPVTDDCSIPHFHVTAAP